MTDIEQYRPGFEAWAQNSGNNYASLKGAKPPAGRWYYFEADVEDAWVVWIAAMVQREASTESADPMDWPLPCDVTVGAGTNKKGTSLRALVARMQMLHRAASAAFPGAQGGNTSNEDAFADVLGPQVWSKQDEMIESWSVGALTDEAKDAACWRYIEENATTHGGGNGFTITCFVPVDEEDMRSGVLAAIAHTKAQEGA